MTPQPPNASTQIPDSVAQDARKMRAVLLLAEGVRLNQTWEEVAEEAGTTRRTLQEWRKDRDFQEAVLILTRENLRDMLPVCFRVLEETLQSGDSRSKLRAAELLLKAMGELVDRVETQTTFNAANMDAKSILANLAEEIEAMEQST
jgi:transcriptional regulator with XRE-family HTH domain